MRSARTEAASRAAFLPERSLAVDTIADGVSYARRLARARDNAALQAKGVASREAAENG
jgi:hypothetical protein